MWSSFSGLILQTGGTEEVYKEQKRQQELENNYKFVWGESQEESQASSTSDSDDVDIWANWPRLVHIKYLSTPVETCHPGLWFRNLTGGHQITPLHLQKTCLRVLNRQFVSSRRQILISPFYIWWFDLAVDDGGVCELAVALYIFQLVSHTSWNLLFPPRFLWSSSHEKSQDLHLLCSLQSFPRKKCRQRNDRG